MIKRIFVLLAIVAWISNLFAQSPSVPLKIKFADIELKLTNYARNEIQMDVNALHVN